MSDLPAFLNDALPFPRRYVSTAWGRVHCIDTQPNGAKRTVLLLHGNPTWCYLYRDIIARVQAADVRLLAPDLIGFGLSDKPRVPSDHTLRRHGETMLELVHALALDDFVLVVQDWGGPIGGWLAAHLPPLRRVRALLAMNTSLLMPRHWRTTPFHRLSHLPIVSDLLFRGAGFPLPVLQRVQGDRASLSRDKRRPYWWPLRRLRDRAGPLGLARMVPNSPSHPSAAELPAIEAWLRAFSGPVELVWGKRDPILGRTLGRHREALPRARVTETDAGHFLQEEVPEVIAAALSRLLAQTSAQTSVPT